MHTKNDFETFMSQLKDTNATLDFYCDFPKITANTKSVDIKLSQLDYLIGKENLDEAIRDLWKENPRTFSSDVLQLLIAVREKDHKGIVEDNGNYLSLQNLLADEDGVIRFFKETGLEKVFKNKQITNLHDYVFGVETGLDTNARKNRSGHIMENRIEKMLRRCGLKYRKEVESTEWKELSCLGTDKKRFDFVVYTKDCTYLMEVNFYSSGGSKLNEVARSYTEIAPKINNLGRFRFVWITDGKGWNGARNKLEEAFYAIPDIYNLTTLTPFLNRIKL